MDITDEIIKSNFSGVYVLSLNGGIEMEETQALIGLLQQELDSLDKFYEGFEDNGTTKKMFDEYTYLFEIFMLRVAEAGYDGIEFQASLQALGAVLDVRLQQAVEEINLNEPAVEELDSISESEYVKLEKEKDDIENTIDYLKNSIKFAQISSIKQVIMLMVFKMTRPKLVLREIKRTMPLEDGSHMAMYADKYNRYIATLDVDFGCSKYGVNLLEDIMGQFVEFDYILGRTA